MLGRLALDLLRTVREQKQDHSICSSSSRAQVALRHNISQQAVLIMLPCRHFSIDRCKILPHTMNDPATNPFKFFQRYLKALKDIKKVA